MDTEVSQHLVEMARAFASGEMRPRAAVLDETEEFPWEVFNKAAEVGLIGYDLPEAYGGGGVESVRVSSRIAEELAWGDSGAAGCLAGGSFFAGPIVALGSEEQKDRWVSAVCGAEPKVAALATTEPEAGSDASAIRTHAKPVGDGYVLNGQKTWISNAPVADLYLVFATVAPGSRSKGITAFVLEKGDEGFNIGRKLPKMGTRCYPAGELFFEDCRIPSDRRIGQEGEGFRSLMEWFDVSRTILAANSVGIGRAALEYAVEYAKDRQSFGKPIHSYQAVSFRLVDAKLRLDQARLLCDQSARLADEGRPFTTEAAMAKVAAAEAAWYTTWACVQTLGGYGYSREYPAERWLRDAKLEEIYEGTSDIQRLVIARSLFS